MAPPATSAASSLSYWKMTRWLRILIVLGCFIFATVIYQYHQSLSEPRITPHANVIETPSIPVPTKQEVRGPRIFDMVLFSTELEMLEIRMNELESVVDYFVVIESEETFQGHYKPLHFQRASRSEAFARFMPRVLHIVVPNITQAEHDRHHQMGSTGPWIIEDYLRNKGIRTALETLRPSPGDWIIHSDMDEIPRASALAKIKKQKNAASPLVLNCDLYYYSFEFKRDEPRRGPVMAQFQLAPTDVDPSSDEPVVLAQNGIRQFPKPLWEDWPNVGHRLRALVYAPEANIIPDACWHCSWCFSTISQVKSKAASYSHTEHNQATYMNNDWIIQHFQQGRDLFDRPETYVYRGPPTDIPQYVADHPEKYAYLTRRYKDPKAAFRDVPGSTDSVAR
ncbi:hypothetical protein DFQ27_006315 [Actinomortierella ambigua]|uniref:Glycosyltransferase family 17 protein n=1 Tax=Actinomortierella ambigua TaxID=1343610 RepID=A0A9P6PY06_9FUNG|nr:hypothetical protein DFQ27_006315 [Actinomortierella ambigua]